MTQLLVLRGDDPPTAIEQSRCYIDLTVCQNAIHLRADFATINVIKVVQRVRRRAIKRIDGRLQDVLVFLQVLVQMIKLVIDALQRDLNLLIELRRSLLFIFCHLLIINDFKIVGSNLRVIRRSVVHVDFGQHARLIVLRLRLPLESHVRAKPFLELHATVLS